MLRLMTAPVIQLASSLAKKSAAFATSLGCPILPSGSVRSHASGQRAHVKMHVHIECAHTGDY